MYLKIHNPTTHIIHKQVNGVVHPILPNSALHAEVADEKVKKEIQEACPALEVIELDEEQYKAATAAQ